MSLNDVQLFLADVAIIIILARLLGIAAKRLGQPPVLGEILPDPADPRSSTQDHRGAVPAHPDPPADRAGRSRPDPVHVRVGYEVDLRLIRGRERVAVACRWARSSCRWASARRLACGWPTATTCTTSPPSRCSSAPRWRPPRSRCWHASHRPWPAPHPHRRDRAGQRRDSGRARLGAAAVVVAIAGSSQQWRVALAIPYVAVMFRVVRPLLRLLARATCKRACSPQHPGHRTGRLLLSCCATQWMACTSSSRVPVRVSCRAKRPASAEILSDQQISVVPPPYLFRRVRLYINLSAIGAPGDCRILPPPSPRSCRAYIGAETKSTAATPRARHAITPAPTSCHSRRLQLHPTPPLTPYVHPSSPPHSGRC